MVLQSKTCTHLLNFNNFIHLLISVFVVYCILVYLGILNFFDYSTDPGDPFQFRLGAKQVLPGLELAVIGSCVRQKLRAHVPPAIGRGTRGFGVHKQRVISLIL